MEILFTSILHGHMKVLALSWLFNASSYWELIPGTTQQGYFWMMYLQLKGNMDPSNVVSMSSSVSRYSHASSDISCHSALSMLFFSLTVIYQAPMLLLITWQFGVASIWWALLLSKLHGWICELPLALVTLVIWNGNQPCFLHVGPPCFHHIHNE